MSVTIQAATHADAEWVGHNLRPADAREVATACRNCVPHRAVVSSLQKSKIAWSLRGPNPIAVWGVSEWGSAWFLGTPEVSKHRRLILDLAPSFLAAMHLVSPRLWNYIDSRNRLHIEWCRIMGFEMEPNKIERGGVPFHYIYRTDPNV